MIEKKIEIVIITYNRYRFLENTLSQLFKSPFYKCKLTILDNCSSDDTSKICEHFIKLFPNMKYIRHDKNIGLGANVLRAFETSNSLYTWIFGDDDNYDFSDCEDFIAAIDSEDFDLLFNEVHKYEDSNGKTINDLLEEKHSQLNFFEKNEKGYYPHLVTSGIELSNLIKRYYFLNMSFIGCCVFKTELFDTECIIAGYDNIYNLYPHFKFMCKSIENNFSIYKVPVDVIEIDYRPSTYSSLRFFNGYFGSCSMIKDSKLYKDCTYHFFESTFFQLMIWSILNDKVSAEKNIRNEVSKGKFKDEINILINTIIKVKGTFKGIFYIIIVLIVSNIPKKTSKKIKDKLEKIRYNSEN